MGRGPQHIYTHLFGVLLVVRRGAAGCIDEVEVRAVTRLSPMPVNVADLLSEADFFNLVAFLVQQRGIGEKR